ncbi:maleylpyruvate isomerase N-terminal domain-containing protein [Actinoplanes sp. CA-030573]|uniref:maleylpyruvate isomerase N-terminal domain-containing protein n=1 Tax=Actinoplanes sp. CA-030573 TaxID=3239898 RepID=UPI003D94A606
MDYRRTFRSAAVSYVDLVSRIPAKRWDLPALGDWTLRDLAGHTVSSALRQVPEVLGTPAEEVAVGTAEGFWAYAKNVPDDILAAYTAASGADAHATGLLLGADPAAVVGELAGRATQALAAAGDDDIVATPIGGMRAREWLRTRTFELVVHGIDTAAAGGVPHGIAPEALAEATTLAARLAVALGDGEALLRALTGRGELPPKYSIV